MSEADDRELKEAEALRRAIDDGVADANVPEDALEAAALLRYGPTERAIDPAADRRILEELLGAQAGRRKRADGARVRFVWAGALVAGTSIAALALLVIAPRLTMQPSPASLVSAIPPPPVALLRAQLDAASRVADADRALEREMRIYRSTILAELSRQ